MSHNTPQDKGKLSNNVKFLSSSNVYLFNICHWLTLIYTAVGLKDTHCFKRYYLQKFLSWKIVKKLIFLVQSIVYLAMLSNLWINVDFIRYLANYFFSSEIECSTVTQGGRVVAGDTQPVLSASPLSWVIRSGGVEKINFF